jgi:tetratricopeptide (TPR) repeat protein
LADERPGWLDVHVNLALALMNRQGEGDADRAEQVLRDRVLAADGGHVRGRYALGLLQLYAGRASEAAEAFRRVVEADRDDAFAAYFLAQSLASSGDHAQALDGYRRTIALNPQFRSAYYGAFHALQGAGRESDGASFLKQFQDLETNPQAIVASSSTREWAHSARPRPSISNLPRRRPLPPDHCSALPHRWPPAMSTRTALASCIRWDQPASKSGSEATTAPGG